jgi:hypothetical protein
MRLKKQKKLLVQEIHGIWKHVSYSQHVAEALLNQDTDIEYSELKNFLAGKNWWEISDDFFESGYPSPFLMSKEVLHYFLPAFMLYAVKTPWIMERLLDHCFFPPKKINSFDSFAQEFIIYSKEEKCSILNFLKYARSYYQHKKIVEINKRYIKRIESAIEGYWCAFDFVQ